MKALFSPNKGLLCLILLWSGVLSLHADWVWSNDFAVTTAVPKWYVATFTYDNKGKNTVRVENVVFSCSCVVSSFEATQAKPGGQGILTVRIARGGEVSPGRDLALLAAAPGMTTKELSIHVAPPGESR